MFVERKFYIRQPFLIVHVNTNTQTKTNMKFQVEVKDQQIKDQIITAIEGGSNYWYFLSDLSMLPERKEGEALSERIGRAVLDEGITVPIYDLEDEEEKLGDLTKESIAKALQTMYEDYPDHFSDMVLEQGDADTADVFLQLAVMNEITFG